jgi:hypothetical protein
MYRYVRWKALSHCLKFPQNKKNVHASFRTIYIGLNPNVPLADLPCKAVAHPPGELERRRLAIRTHIVVYPPLEQAREPVLLYVSALGGDRSLCIRPDIICIPDSLSSPPTIIS